MEESRFPQTGTAVSIRRNGGVTKARLFKKAKGKYINFLDSDDKWAEDAFDLVKAAFENNTIDIIACRTKRFDANDNWYIFDYKFHSDYIVDGSVDYKKPQKAVSSVFIRKEALGDVKFDERIKHAEDLNFINKIIVNNKNRYMILRSAVFFYRKRQNENESLLSISTKNPEWYFETMEYSYGDLLTYCKSKLGYVPKYIQFTIMDDLKWRFRTPLLEEFSNADIERYFQLFRTLLYEISDEIICETANFWKEHKVECLSLKYMYDVRKHIKIFDNKYLFRDNIIHRINKKDCQLFSIIEKEKDIEILGIVDTILCTEDFSIVVEDDNSCKVRVETVGSDPNWQKTAFGKKIGEATGFKIIVPKTFSGALNIFLKTNHEKIQLPIQKTNITCRLSSWYDECYCVLGGKIICKRNDTLYFSQANKGEKIKHEVKLLRRLLKEKNRRVFLWRILILICRFFYRGKRIWLVLDQFSKAGDNGEAFYRYLHANKECLEDKLVYFVLTKESPDYKRLSSTGKVLQYNSIRYRIIFALSEAIISSQSFYNKLNTFEKHTGLVKDLFNWKFVYLQHGVIKDNHADTQSRYKKDFSLFITSSSSEADSIVNGIGGNYCYDNDVVKVTGLARFDEIYGIREQQKPKSILIAPTWRKGIVGPWSEKLQTYEYSDRYRESVFFDFYNTLINDDKLLYVMKELGYSGTLRLHERMKLQWNDYKPNEYFYVESNKRSYKEELVNTGLLVTDYSSISFDYAYAGIPVIYTQFDKESFYSNHAYKRGYFDYSSMGFGPVCYSYDSTVKEIINMLENGCKMKFEYENRVEQFFDYYDNENCKRTYNEIKRILGDK